MQEGVVVAPGLVVIAAPVEVADHHDRFVRIDAVVERAHVRVEVVGVELLEAVDQEVPQVGLVEIVEPRLGSRDLRAPCGNLPPERTDACHLGVEVELADGFDLFLLRQRNGWDRHTDGSALTGLQIRGPLHRPAVLREAVGTHQEPQPLARVAGRQNTVFFENEPLVASRIRSEPQGSRGLLRSGRIDHPDLHQQHRGRIQGDTAQFGDRQNRLLFVVDGPVLPPCPQHRQVAIQQFPAAAKLVARESARNPQPFAIPELPLAVPGTSLDAEPAAHGGDFDLAVGILAHRVAIAGQAVHEIQRPLERHVVPGIRQRLLVGGGHAVVHRLAAELSPERLAIVFERDGIVASRDEDAQIVHENPVAFGHFIGRKGKRPRAGTDGDNRPVVAPIDRIGSHHKVRLDGPRAELPQSPREIGGRVRRRAVDYPNGSHLAIEDLQTTRFRFPRLLRPAELDSHPQRFADGVRIHAKTRRSGHLRVIADANRKGLAIRDSLPFHLGDLIRGSWGERELISIRRPLDMAFRRDPAAVRPVIHGVPANAAGPPLDDQRIGLAVPDSVPVLKPQFRSIRGGLPFAKLHNHATNLARLGPADAVTCAVGIRRAETKGRDVKRGTGRKLLRKDSCGDEKQQHHAHRNDLHLFDPFAG